MSLASRAFDRVRRFLVPGWDEQRRALHKVLQQIEKTGRHRAESDADVRKRLSELADLVNREARQRQQLGQRIGGLQRDVRDHAKTNEQLWRRAGRVWSHVGQQQRIFRRLDRMQASRLPIVVGPWTGEVGFELLYWIPFLQWALASRGIDPARVVAVSRGGTDIWYSSLAGRYLELFDIVPPQQFRDRTEASKKQRQVTPFDTDIVRLVRRRLGLTRFHVLHPQLMYRLFLPAWRREPAASDVESFTQFKVFDAPPREWWQSMLPSTYVAVKLYFSLAFPATEENRAFATRVVHWIASRVPVVLLTSGTRVDDHEDWRMESPGRVVTIDHLLSPSRNLDVQTRVLAGARAFVGTYGGFSYLAPFLGVPSLSFFSQRDAFFPHHLELADRVFGRLNGGRFLALDTHDFETFERVIGGLPTWTSDERTIG